MFNPFRVRLPIPRVNVVKRGMLTPSLPRVPKPKRRPVRKSTRTR